MIDDTNKPAETVAANPNTVTANAKLKVATPATARKTAGSTKSAASKPVRKRPVAASKNLKRPVAASKPAQVAKPVAPKKADKPAKAKKVKLVRDSYTMPEAEYAVISLLKKRCLAAGVSAKKSEILRAAVAVLAKLNDSSVIAAIRRLEVIKTGRPAKGSK